MPQWSSPIRQMSPEVRKRLRNGEKQRKMLDNQLDEQRLQQAVRHHQQGRSTTEIENVFGIRRNKLHRRMHGVKPATQAHVHQQGLTPAAEEALVARLAHHDKQFAPFHWATVCQLAESMAQENGQKSTCRFNRSWFDRFMSRHPELQSQWSKTHEKLRVMARRPQVLIEYYDKVRTLSLP